MRLLAAVLAAAVVFAADQQSPASSALLAGRTTDGDTGRPIAGALVILSSNAQGTAIAADRVITDEQGRFVFHALAPGAYHLTATKAGYTVGQSGRRRIDGPARPVELADAERRIDIDLPMWRAASVAGSVLDEVGDPVVGVAVWAFPVVDPLSATAPSPPRGGGTDDRGRYNISALAPGSYIVGVTSRVIAMPVAVTDSYLRLHQMGEPVPGTLAESGAPTPAAAGVVIGDRQVWTTGPAFIPSRSDGGGLAYLTTFHPSSLRASQASRVTLRSGDQRSGVDVHMRPTPTAPVSGVAIGPSGPETDLAVRVIPVDTAPFLATADADAALATTDGAGRFTLFGIAEGNYVLSAFRIPREGASTQFIQTPVAGQMLSEVIQHSGRPVGPTIWADVPISVGPDGATNVEIVLRPGARISGSVQFEGVADRPDAVRLQRMAVTLSAAGRPLPRVAAVRLDADGRFTTFGYPPGKYFLTIAPPGPQWHVKAVLVDGMNALERPFTLETHDRSGVIVTFTDRVTEVSGTVTMPGIAPGHGDATVMTFPIDFQDWLENGGSPHLTATTTTSPAGQFRLSLTLPGEYFVIALPADVTPSLSREVLTSYARVATRVSIEEGKPASVNLTLVRPR